MTSSAIQRRIFPRDFDGLVDYSGPGGGIVSPAGSLSFCLFEIEVAQIHLPFGKDVHGKHVGAPAKLHL